MITLTGLTKRFGPKVAVDDLTCEVRPGRVTGFLGPNGAGKSTTLRMIVGLDRPSAGSALIDGQPYARLRDPLRQVGAVLDTDDAHPGRTAYAHLAAVAAGNRIPRSRVEAVLSLAGVSDVAGRRVKTFSLGMRQRLGIATALLGDPPVLLLDEPVNGLDPDGVRWIRGLMRSLAAEGRTVFVSSHLLSEMQETADHLVLLGRGRMIADAPLVEILGSSSRTAVRVRTPEPDRLAEHLRIEGATAERSGADTLVVTGVALDHVGDLAFRERIPLHELTTRSASLEEVFVELTGGELEYASGPAVPDGTGAAR